VTLFYLVEYLWEAGASLSTGMGSVPLTWQELKAWQEQTGIELQPWELRIIRKASQEYVVQAQEAHKPDCPPPGKIVEQDQLKVAKHIKQVLRG